MKRLYTEVVKDHFSENNQMCFLAGPRQVGKTSISEQYQSTQLHTCYLNWDRNEDRTLILSSSDKLAEYLQLDQLSKTNPLIIFDEIHKYPNWKTFLKGFYDTYKHKAHILVTGSARLDIFKKGGDSMMGRYFRYRIHPLSLGEIARQSLPEQAIQPPMKQSDDVYENLFQYGGFPDPFIRANSRFSTRWKQLRQQQLIYEDIRSLSQLQDLAELEKLMIILQSISGGQLNYNKLSKHIRASVPTVQRWMQTLKDFYYCYTIQPWSKNISRSLIKEPKLYLWDWSNVEDSGARAENFIASHLLKSVHFWTDFGFGDFELYYLRDTQQREVDFCVTRNGKPWFIVEVKSSKDQSLNKHLKYFQNATNAPHAFQVCIDAPYIDRDCFETHEPTIIPAKTFLSQLV